MTKKIAAIFPLLFVALFSFAQSPLGVWKTADGTTDEPFSHIEIYEEDGEFKGKVVKIVNGNPDALCEDCDGDKKNAPILGLELLWDLEPYKDYWSSGRIIDPRSGKVYKCNVSMESDDVLKLRGYIGFAALGRTEYWYRVK